jgi:site-specific recombinase XerD
MLTLTQATAEFFNHCQYEKNLSPKTINFYRIDLLQQSFERFGDSPFNLLQMVEARMR